MRIYAPQLYVPPLATESLDTRTYEKTNISQLVWLALVIIIAFSHVNSIILNSSLLQLEEISVQGNELYTQDKIVNSSGLQINRDLIHQVSEEEIAARIEKLNYIKEAVVSKHYLLKTVSINITERKKTAKIPCIIEKKPLFMIVDRSGYVLEYLNLPDLSHSSLVKIIGKSAELGSQLVSEQVQTGLKVLDLIQKRAEEIFSELDSIDASETDRIRVRLRNMPLILLSSDQLVIGVNRLKLFFQHLKQAKQAKKRMGVYLDFRFEDAVYLMEKKQDGN